MLAVELDSALQHYLAWTRKASRRLFVRRGSLPLGPYAVPVLDVPLSSEVRRVVDTARAAGYRAANVGLTGFWKGTVPFETVDLIAAQLAIRAAHGTSIKPAIRAGRPYREFLARDLGVLESLDPHGEWLINYDLYAGHISYRHFSRSFAASHAATTGALLDVLQIPARGDAELAILRHLIHEVASVYHETGRRICFEIPGTKGWSLLPELTGGKLDAIADMIDEALPSAMLCIDVGHVLTWGRDQQSVARVLEIIRPFARRIGMLHISSAGSWQRHFLDAYGRGPGAAYPVWHRRALDLSLPVCEPVMLDLIEGLRAMSGAEVLEVSETRMPSAAIRDYFPDVDASCVDDSPFFAELVQQAALLGYARQP